MAAPRPPVPPDVKSLHANLHAWWRRLSSIKSVKTQDGLAAFHRWEADSRPKLQALGVTPGGEPDERLLHYREAIRRHVRTLEAEHPALKAPAKSKRKTLKPRAPRKS